MVEADTSADSLVNQNTNKMEIRVITETRAMDAKQETYTLLATDVKHNRS